MARRMMLFTLMALCAFAVVAGRYDKQVEASMLVTGELVVAPDGTVKSYKLDRADALPSAARDLLTNAIPGWELDIAKADGSPLLSPAAVKMSVKLVARRIAGVDDQFRITIQDSAFEDPQESSQIQARGKLTPPRYPASAAGLGVSGIVYVVLRLDPDGTVAQTHVERVDMTVVGDERSLERFRKILAESAVSAAKRWTFDIAPELLADPGPIDVRVPIDFVMVGKKQLEYGQWHAYVPGTYAPVPWRISAAGGVGAGIGAMVPGRFYSMDPTIKLRQPPAGT